jgi:hypothetical protein
MTKPTKTPKPHASSSSKPHKATKPRKPTPPPTPKGTKPQGEANKSAREKNPQAWGLTKAPKKEYDSPLPTNKGDAQNASQAHLDRFQNAIHNQGKHPKEAAESAGDSKYTKLKGAKNQYEIRLDGGNRATFTVDEDNKMVHLHQAGGHT